MLHVDSVSKEDINHLLLDANSRLDDAKSIQTGLLAYMFGNSADLNNLAAHTLNLLNSITYYAEYIKLLKSYADPRYWYNKWREAIDELPELKATYNQKKAVVESASTVQDSLFQPILDAYDNEYIPLANEYQQYIEEYGANDPRTIAKKEEMDAKYEVLQNRQDAAYTDFITWYARVLKESNEALFPLVQCQQNIPKYYEKFITLGEPYKVLLYTQEIRHDYNLNNWNNVQTLIDQGLRVSLTEPNPYKRYKDDADIDWNNAYERFVDGYDDDDEPYYKFVKVTQADPSYSGSYYYEDFSIIPDNAVWTHVYTVWDAGEYMDETHERTDNPLVMGESFDVTDTAVKYNRHIDAGIYYRVAILYYDIPL